MEKKTWLRVLLVATFLIRIALAAPLVSALGCENFSFTGQKLEDCHYIMGSGDLSSDEKDNLLVILDQQSYSYEEDTQQVSTSLFRIETDKPAYKPGETVNVDIFPKDTLVSVSYGGITKQAKDKTSFTAKEDDNTILAQLDNNQYRQDIIVRKDDPIILAWKIFLFCFANYFAFSSITKSSFLAKWLNAVS